MNTPRNLDPHHYLVTGGLGFIGSHLVDALLSHGHRVSVLDDLSTGRPANCTDPRAAIHIGSVCDRALVESLMATVDGCFHLAAVSSVARSHEDWRGTSEVNLLGTVNVFEAAAKRTQGPVPVVFTSSAAVYGEAKSLPIDETSRMQPLSAYGADKLAGELHAKVGGVGHGLKSFGLRPFNVYGPRQNPHSSYSGVISIFIERARRGDDLLLIGGGRQERDFVFVGDVVRFFLAAMDAADRSAPVVNVATAKTIDIAALARTIVSLTGSRSKLVVAPPRAGDIQCSAGSTALAEELLGVRAETSLPDGLRRLLNSLDGAPAALNAESRGA